MKADCAEVDGRKESVGERKPGIAMISAGETCRDLVAISGQGRNRWVRAMEYLQPAPLKARQRESWHLSCRKTAGIADASEMVQTKRGRKLPQCYASRNDRL